MSGEKQTLVNLTQGFLKILTEAKGEDVELSYCEKQLKTTKRRLYDVINVLSGVSLVERSGKSKVHWTEEQNAQGSLGSDQMTISDQEKELDLLLEKVESELSDLSHSELFNKCAWISKEELIDILSEENAAFFALSGPQSMSIKGFIAEDEPLPHHLLFKDENNEGEIEMCQLTQFSPSAT